MLIAAVHESLPGTKRTSPAGVMMSVVRARPEVAFLGRQVRVWTQRRHRAQFDQLVGGREERFRHLDAELSGGLKG